MTFKKSLDSEQYLDWYRSANNVFYAKAEQEQVSYEVRLLTTDYEIANEQMDQVKSSKELKKLQKASKEQLTILMKVSIPWDGNDIFSYNPSSAILPENRMNYFAFAMKQDIRLLTNNLDTINCSQLLFEKGLNQSTSGTFVLDFDNISTKNVSALLIHDRALSGGKFVLSLKKWNKTKLPKLKI
jgi:hypothetical protein